MKSILPLCAIILVWGLFILPSAFDPNWGSLDDPTTLIVSQSLASHFHIPLPDGSTGRYFPVYWLYYALLFHLFGFHLAGYYAVQAIMFLLTLLLVYSIVHKTARSRYAGLLAALLVCTASPVAENVYTFGKAEPRVLFYFLCAIYLFMRLEKFAEREKTVRLVSWIGILLLIAGAILTKETAALFVIFPAAGMFMTLPMNSKRNGIDRQWFKSYSFLCAGSICAILLSRGLYYALRPSVSTEIYVSYSVTMESILSNLLFYAGQQPDVLVLGLLTPALAIIAYQQRDEENRQRFVLTTAWFLTGAAYFFALMIWRQSLGYYLLIPAALFAIASVIMASIICRASSRKYRWLGYLAVAFLVLTRLYSIPYFSYIAQAQKAQDKIYTEAIRTYMQVANGGERLLVEEWPFFVESVIQSNILLKRIFRKEQLVVEGVQDLLADVAIPPETKKLYQVTALPEEQARHPRKDDYILTLTGKRQSARVLRGVSPFLNERGSSYKKKGMELQHIKTTTIQWSGLPFTPTVLNPAIQTYSSGYRLYKVLNPVPVVEWEGRWADDWISRSAHCSLRLSKKDKEFVFRGFVTEFTVPSVLHVLIDDKIIKKVPLNKSGPFSFAVDVSSGAGDGLFRVGFAIKETFNPRDLGHSDDHRNLSVRLRVKDIEAADF